MPSPFPGMDPYIEESWRWGDFHNNLAAQIQAQLNRVIRPNYYALTVPYITYESLGVGRSKRTSPDVSLFQNLPSLKEAKAEYVTDSPATPPEPVESSVIADDPLTLHFVEVHSVGDDELVTVIEILSPINKRAGIDAYDQYLRKRQYILNTESIHLLEIDLLRGGTRPPLHTPVPEAPYYVVLSRAETRPQVKVWPIQLNDLLPTVEVPLGYPDPDAMLDISEAVANVYENGAYDLQITYTKAPPPPKLSKEQKELVTQILHGAS